MKDCRWILSFGWVLLSHERFTGASCGDYASTRQKGTKKKHKQNQQHKSEWIVHRVLFITDQTHSFHSVSCNSLCCVLRCRLLNIVDFINEFHAQLCQNRRTYEPTCHDAGSGRPAQWLIHFVWLKKIWQRQTDEFSYEDGKEIERWANGERMEHIAMIYHTHSWFINIEITNKIHGSFFGTAARKKITYAIRFGCAGNPSVRFTSFLCERSQMSVSISDCDVYDDCICVLCMSLLRHSIAARLYLFFSNFIWSRKAITNVRIKSFGYEPTRTTRAVKQDVKTSTTIQPAPNSPPVTLYFVSSNFGFASPVCRCLSCVSCACVGRRYNTSSTRLCCVYVCAFSPFCRSSRYYILCSLSFSFSFLKNYVSTCMGEIMWFCILQWARHRTAHTLYTLK